MARGINKVILVGNAGIDPEVRNMPSGGMVANIRLATSESWTDKGGEKQEKTEWHRIVFFGKLAEIVSQYVTKGQQIYIEGALRTRKWQDKDGRDQYTTEVVANEMQMLGGRASGSSSHDDNNQNNERNNERQQNQRPAQKKGVGAPKSNPPADNWEGDFDSDIPF